MTQIGENTQGQTAPNNSTKQGDAWLCLRFTKLSLNCLDIEHRTEQAIAVTENQQIYQCSERAKKFGIQISMSINHALMLQPDLKLIERNHVAEETKLQELSYWAYRFTSLVSLYNEHTLLLEIGKSIRLFNGLTHLLHLITRDLEGFNIHAEIGLAYTPKAAYVLSFEAYHLLENNISNDIANSLGNSEHLLNQSYTHLLATPLNLLDVPQKTIHQLQHCGFEHIDDIECGLASNRNKADLSEFKIGKNGLSLAELGQRFGADFIVYLQQLWGKLADPQIGITPPETFHSSADFSQPIRNLNWIQQQLDRLLHDLDHFISVRQLICRSFTWRFFHENNRLLKTVTIGLSAKQNGIDTFKQLSDLKLASITLNWEFSSIELSSKQLVPKQLFNDDLFDPQPDQEEFNQLIDKFSNRLGQHALFRVHHAPEQLPELANDRQHAVQESTASYLKNISKQLDASSIEPLKDQPLWLLENPQRLAQQGKHPLYQGPLNIIHGPDRILSHWWSKIQSRDYFIARQLSGRLLWVYYDRSQRHWFLHGLFA